MPIAKEAPLCSSCQQIFSSLTEPSSPTSGYSLLPKFAQTHHPSIASLKEAAEARCPICVVVAAALPSEPLTTPLEGNATSFNISKDKDNFAITVFINPSKPVFFNVPQVEQGQGNRDNELQGFGLCYRWISDCLVSENPTHHGSCRNHRTRSQAALKRPSRLIQLRKEGDDAHVSYTVRQYPSGQESSSNPVYATIIHPDWPDNLVSAGEFQLQNVDSWASVSQLPNCLQQAAQIALDAGVQYIWTPKLRANDSEDPITTAHIFASSAFNIAAMACTMPADPLLPSEELSRMPVVRPQWNPQQTLAIYKKESFRDSVCDSPLWHSPLFYQAILLSPATLYCGKDQLWWQCYHGRGAICSEALAATGNRCRTVDNQEGALGQLEPDESYARENFKTYANFDPLPSASSSSGAGSSGHADFRGFESPQKCLAAMWTHIIPTCSKVGGRTSKEIAATVSGIAECVPPLAAPGAADLINSLSYAHACWSADLVEQLAWHFDIENGLNLPHRDKTADRFPTWSWLSAPGRVNFQFPVSTNPGIVSTNMLPEDIFLSPVAKARFVTAEECGAIGVVTAGSVQACGRLIPVTVETPSSEADPLVLRLEGLGNGYVKWDCRDELDRAIGKGKDEGSGSDTYCAWPIYAHYYKDFKAFGARGILLRRIQKGQGKVLVRCGWFEYQGEAGGDEPQVFDKVPEEEFSII
ncbi:hypothetical protein F5B19DRAFT_447690 [Rostrohypoxylon terebratum]|nr:hypothetical protein F5B19DRAFT_447690 [Rostrohypoxylon terebratum]